MRGDSCIYSTGLYFYYIEVFMSITEKMNSDYAIRIQGLLSSWKNNHVSTCTIITQTTGSSN